MTRDELLQKPSKTVRRSPSLDGTLKNKITQATEDLTFANFTRCEAMGVCTTEQEILQIR